MPAASLKKTRSQDYRFLCIRETSNPVADTFRGFTMIRITHASLLAAAIGAALTLPFAERAAAQEVGGRGTADITSPEVTSDRRVTFRLRAPEAKAVTISGDFGSDAVMRKGDGGVWSVTVGPHPDDRQEVPDDRWPQAPGDRRLLDGRRAGRAFRAASPRDVQSGRSL
jgi:hypothetical protein